MRGSLEGALLQRQAIEERFQVDVFLGDVSWETSYSLPGEEQPPRVRADLSVDWPTWSQTNYRSWSIGVTPDELPEVVIEVARMGPTGEEMVPSPLPGSLGGWTGATLTPPPQPAATARVAKATAPRAARSKDLMVP